MTRYINLVVGFLVLLLLFFTATLDGGFWWSDAPRHALNGVFLKDALFDFPIDAPKEYAIEYYKQYPALTILFYPPLFPAVESLFYMVFGVHVWIPVLVVMVFYAVTLIFAYKILSRHFDQGMAMILSLIFILLPEMAEWGRQVMLEIHAYAMVLVSVYFYLLYVEENKLGRLLLAVLFLAAAMLSKFLNSPDTTSGTKINKFFNH